MFALSTTPELVASTAAELDRVGFVCLENVVSADWLDAARGAVCANIKNHGERFFSIIRPADDAAAPFGQLAHDPGIQQLMRGLAERSCPHGVIDSEDVYNVLRVIAGPDGGNGAHQYHYDASVVTLLVPIFMPETARGMGGELITFANRRGYRNWALTNIIEKVWLQNRWQWRHFEQQSNRDRDSLMHVLYPGNIYAFWGYRTLHGNLPCAPGSLRATMLLHYGNPHGTGPLMQAIRSIRKRVEARRRNRA